MPAPGQPRGPVDFRDLGLAKLKDDIAKLQQSEITIGWQGESGDATHPSGEVTVAEVAAFAEYGTDRAPARPALQTTFARAGAALRRRARKVMADLVDGRADVEGAAQDLGEHALAELRSAIDDAGEWAEELADSTVARKGHDTPLLDSGTMRDQASWAVRRDGVIVEQGGEE